MAFQRYASYCKWEMFSWINFAICKWMKFYADHRHKECKWNTISNSVTILLWKMSAGIHMWYVKLSPLGIFTVHSIFMWSVWKIHKCLFIEKCVLSLTNFSGRHLFEAFHSHAQSSQFVDCLLPQDGKLVERMFIVPHTYADKHTCSASTALMPSVTNSYG